MNFIFVVSYGRSGSTVLMRSILDHPAIVGRRLFPYETRTAQYVYVAGKLGAGFGGDVLSYKGSAYRGALPNDEPLREILGRKNSPDSGNSRAVAEAIYAELAGIERKATPRFAAEKGIGLDLVLELFETWPATRLVFLMRDPRSIFFSVKSFNRKRQSVSFGEEYGDTKLLERIVNFSCAIRKLSDRTGRSGRTMPIRYEDMMRMPHLEMTRFLEFLGLPANTGILERMSHVIDHKDKHAAAHMTTESAQSIERWRSEVTDEYVNLFGEQSKQLTELGYS